jgi:hypothetical protein
MASSMKKSLAPPPVPSPTDDSGGGSCVPDLDEEDRGDCSVRTAGEWGSAANPAAAVAAAVAARVPTSPSKARLRQWMVCCTSRARFPERRLHDTGRDCNEI